MWLQPSTNDFTLFFELPLSVPKNRHDRRFLMKPEDRPPFPCKEFVRAPTYYCFQILTSLISHTFSAALVRIRVSPNQAIVAKLFGSSALPPEYSLLA